jgi:hypothetical protein
MPNMRHVIIFLKNGGNWVYLPQDGSLRKNKMCNGIILKQNSGKWLGLAQTQDGGSV